VFQSCGFQGLKTPQIATFARAESVHFQGFMCFTPKPLYQGFVTDGICRGYCRFMAPMPKALQTLYIHSL